jgi:DNA-binding NtrC family response regulator
VSPVGSDTDIPVDVRIVAATHRNLEEMVAQGKFRADLYFRLAVVPIHLPALRDRGDDIELVADLCVARARERVGRAVEGLDASARSALRSYAWPGNVRELSHLIERAVLLARRARLGEADLQVPGAKKTSRGSGEFPTLRMPRLEDSAAGTMPDLSVAGIDSSLDLRSALENLERQLIDRALNKANGNRTEAAALLGLNRTTLVEKLRKYAT